MRRDLFLQLVHAVDLHDSYFVQSYDAVGRKDPLFLADSIYPTSTLFVKTISEAQGRKATACRVAKTAVTLKSTQRPSTKTILGLIDSFV
ncbi:hypothetical protein H257_18194 [Aphanomyces astaci]|uniref:Uncharacterized protein n=1 Tax=Aphanomyces astaci TaxID=112090 RepID=W4FDS5_APHAT|nr:hypothetical protein H257_18194 [Aphanomyces astaci]ETV64986.1 hypothetical protein H257_18194 [Aphanomyces astaci]|eukprot:XP_009845511.1 hypothetical protein H257_18194 [Aphanomyces astaci]